MHLGDMSSCILILQVLDVTHRRQVAQEGLSDTGRSWSFAPDSQQGAEIATVPEELDLPEMGSSGSKQRNNVDNV